MSVSQYAERDLGFAPPPQPRLRRNQRWRLTTLQRARRIAEAGLVLLAGTAMAFALQPSLAAMPTDRGLIAAAVAAVSALSIASSTGAGHVRPLALAGQTIASGLLGAASLALLDVAWQTDLAWLAGETVVAFCLIALLRAVFAELVELMRADGRLATHVAIVGAGAVAQQATARLQSSDPLQVSVIGRYADGATNDADLLRGDLRTLLCDCRTGIIDAIVLALDDEHTLRDIRAELRPCVQDVYLATDFAAKASDDARVVPVGGTPLILVTNRPINGRAGVAKDAFDRFGACLLLAVMAPLLLFIALIIRLETRGPIFFRQLRVGYDNRLFYIYKFRSMYTDSSDRLAKQQTVHGDKRVTRVGRIIRRLSLDELPQLLNVVRGEMSLVGPRPHAPGTSVAGQRVHTLIDNYASRHRVRPGITGLAQVRGQRGGLQTRAQVAERLTSDLEYIETWSFWLDIKILLQTTLLELRGSHGV